MNKVVFLGALSLFAASAACTVLTTKGPTDLDAAKLQGKGTVQAFAGACSSHWPAVRDTVERLGLDTVDESQPSTVYASSAKRGELGGNVVGVWLEPATDGTARCAIRVVSMRRDEAMPDPNDWDAKFFKAYRAPAIVEKTEPGTGVAHN